MSLKDNHSCEYVETMIFQASHVRHFIKFASSFRLDVGLHAYNRRECIRQNPLEQIRTNQIPQRSVGLGL